MNVSQLLIFSFDIESILFKDPLSDDEISLQTLFNCQMNTEKALVKFRQLPVKTICKNVFLLSHSPSFRKSILDSYPEWSLEEIQSLEEGLRVYGKNFFKISEIKVAFTVISSHMIENFPFFLVPKPKCS